MQEAIDALGDLGQGQRVRVTVDDTDAVQLRVNQMDYRLEEYFRLELTSDEDSDDFRYRIATRFEEGEWNPIELERYEQEADEWTTLGEVTDATPLDTYRTMSSDDMKAQASTGSESESGDEDIREVKLSGLDELLEEFDYPCSHETAVAEGRTVTLLLADGTENLGDVIERSTDDTFDSMDDLETEVMNLLPRTAVGEPYQSEGEG